MNQSLIESIHQSGPNLHAVVVRLLAVVGAVSGEAFVAVVEGGEAEEAVLQRVVALLVPLEVPDHLLLLHEHLGKTTTTTTTRMGVESSINNTENYSKNNINIKS